jgi:hypothetical protein
MKRTGLVACTIDMELQMDVYGIFRKDGCLCAVQYFQEVV